jgi:hypothetical protein
MLSRAAPHRNNRSHGHVKAAYNLSFPQAKRAGTPSEKALKDSGQAGMTEKSEWEEFSLIAGSVILKTAVIHAKTQSSQRKTKSWNTKIIHLFGGSVYNRNFAFFLCDLCVLCGEMLFSGSYNITLPSV